MLLSQPEAAVNDNDLILKKQQYKNISETSEKHELLIAVLIRSDTEMIASHSW